MVNYCCVRGCGRNNKNNKHLYFYGVPKDLRQEKWLIAAGRDDILKKPQEKRILHRVCSRHFAPSSFKNKHLCSDAIPTLYLPGQNDNEAIPDESDDIKQQHHNITCNNCGDSVTRFRYKCISCPNYDLCSRCEMTEAHAQHIMLRIPEPTRFKCVDKMVKKCQVLLKEADSDDSSDDEPITKYVKNYDSGVDLPEDVKEALRNEVTRVLDLKPKAVVSQKRSSDVEKSFKTQKVEPPSNVANSTEMVFADVNEIPGVGQDVKNVLIAFESHEEPLMQMKLSEDLSELMMEVSEHKY